LIVFEKIDSSLASATVESNSLFDNSVVFLPQVSGGFIRAMIGKKYKYPFTIEEIGVNNVLLGIKCVLYN